MCIYHSWSDLTKYQSKWAKEWKKILKTEQYETMATSVFRNHMFGKVRSLELNVFHKEVMKREERFRLKELGVMRKVRPYTIFNILFMITLLALGQY